MEQGMDPATYEELMKQQTEQQQLLDPNAGIADSMREEKVANIISQLNPDNQLEEIENRIKGKRYDKFSGEWVNIGEKPLEVSDLLVSNFMSFLGAVLNQNTSLSNYSAQEINNMMKLVIMWIRSDLSVNAKAYNLEGKYVERTRIGHIICLNCFSVFKRSMNGMESRRIFGMLKVTENLTQNPQRKDKWYQFW